MQIERAKEIFNSTGVIDVHYNGQPIWIKGINEFNSTVEIEGINNILKKNTVDVNDLHELQ